MAVDWVKVDEHVESVIVPILTKYGAVVKAKHYPCPEPEPGRAWPDLLTIEFQGETIPLDSNTISKNPPKALEHLLKYFEQFKTVEHHLRAHTDPFYSTITGYLKHEFGNRTTIDTQLGFAWICDKIKASGRKVWS